MLIILWHFGEMYCTFFILLDTHNIGYIVVTGAVNRHITEARLD